MRHRAVGSPARLRAVLHDQGARQGNRARPRDRAQHRPRARRLDPPRERARAGHGRVRSRCPFWQPRRAAGPRDRPRRSPHPCGILVVDDDARPGHDAAGTSCSRRAIRSRSRSRPPRRWRSSERNPVPRGRPRRPDHAGDRRPGAHGAAPPARPRTWPSSIMTGYGTIETAVEAIKRGAEDYVTKPFDRQAVRKKIGAAAWRSSSCGSSVPQLEANLERSPSLRDDRLRLAARCSACIERARMAAATDASRARCSARPAPARRCWRGRSTRPARGPAGPSCPSTAARCPRELVESELFGVRRGAFTGAYADAPGIFAAAHGGHGVPRRDRRDAEGGPGQAAARAAGGGGAAGRRARRPSRWTCGSSRPRTGRSAAAARTSACGRTSTSDRHGRHRAAAAAGAAGGRARPGPALRRPARAPHAAARSRWPAPRSDLLARAIRSPATCASSRTSCESATAALARRPADDHRQGPEAAAARRRAPAAPGRDRRAAALHGAPGAASPIQQALRLCQGNRTKAASLLGISRDTLYRKLRQAKAEG